MVQDNGFSKLEQITDFKTLDQQLPGFNLSEISIFLDGNQAQLQNLFTMFVEDFADIDQQIVDLLAVEKFTQAEHLLHQMKGVAGNLGAQNLFAVSQILDAELKLGYFNQHSLENWQIKVNETLCILRDFLSSQPKTAPLRATPHQVDVNANLLELDALLAKNLFVGEDLLFKLMQANNIAEDIELQKLLKYIRHYDYLDARQVIACLLNK
jgi:HPt (histidine-containing phosphotransfer) domain-containing protein